jgi:hypothetical protein
MLAFRERFPARKENIKGIYGLESIPEDTALRECLDKVEPSELMSCFKMLVDESRHDGLLESKKVLQGHLVVSFDGTGYFASHVASYRCRDATSLLRLVQNTF